MDSLASRKWRQRVRQSRRPGQRTKGKLCDGRSRMVVLVLTFLRLIVQGPDTCNPRFSRFQRFPYFIGTKHGLEQVVDSLPSTTIMCPAKVLRQFQTIPPNPTEIEFQGPYNKLLNILFPPDSDFVVVPRYLSDSRNAADFMVMFEVLLVDRPVMILQLKPPSHYNFQSKLRQAVDDQIRVHMTDLAGERSQVPALQVL